MNIKNVKKSVFKASAISLIALILALFLPMCSSKRNSSANNAAISNRSGLNYMPAGSSQAGGIVDLALIHDGDLRTEWNQQAFKPYLTWTNPDTKVEEWLFDGFLFLEGPFQNFSFSYDAQTLATKADKLNYWDNMLFAKNKSLDALDRELGEVIKRIGAPPRPRRIVLMVPDMPPPQVNPRQRPWGELNGNNILNFENTQDRLAVIKWYIDQIMERWEKAELKNLELAGLYWLRENVYFWAYDYERDKNFIKECVDYMRYRSGGKTVFWIPYWDAKGSDEWREMGFDIAYQQPNHQFDSRVPDDRVAQACIFAEKHGMGMELEWQKELFQDPDNYVRRLWVNINVFEEFGVWSDAAVAHYMGGTVPGTNLPYALEMLSQSNDPRHIELYRKLCSIIAERQKRFSN